VPAVLAARIRARRRRRANEPRPVRRSGPHGDLVIDRSARRVFVRDHEIVLRVKEFDLLDTLASNAGRVVTRTTLMSVVWDEHWFRSTKTLDVTMVGLRRRLREAADLVDAVVPEISTIRGVGYRMDPVHRRQPPVAYTVTSRPR
jgi:DNA-binding response OmpR family regulator